MLKGRGRYWKTDSKLYVYIPKDVVADSQFPLKEEKGDITVEISGDALIIRKAGS